MYRIGLIVEYSRMKVPSLSRGCEIAQFFVRYMGTYIIASDARAPPLNRNMCMGL